jgi:hypothetical protein
MNTSVHSREYSGPQFNYLCSPATLLLESHMTSIKYPLLRAFEVILKNSLLSKPWVAGLLKESYCACHCCCLHYIMDVKTGYIVIANAKRCDDVVWYDCNATSGAISVHITYKVEQGAVFNIKWVFTFYVRKN